MIWIRWGRHPVASIEDEDAWMTLQRRFRLADYMPVDYAYREGLTWRIARPTGRLPRGLCIDRPEGLPAELRRRLERAEIEAVGRRQGKPFRFKRRSGSFDGRNPGLKKPEKAVSKKAWSQSEKL